MRMSHLAPRMVPTWQPGCGCIIQMADSLLDELKKFTPENPGRGWVLIDQNDEWHTDSELGCELIDTAVLGGYIVIVSRNNETCWWNDRTMAWVNGDPPDDELLRW